MILSEIKMEPCGCEDCADCLIQQKDAYIKELEKESVALKYELSEAKASEARVRERAERVLSYFEEFTLEPYKDSDPLSLLYTLRARAKEAIRAWRESEGKCGT